MSTTYTPNFHLGKQTDTSDNFNMSVITDNMDIIDTQMMNDLYGGNAWTEFVFGYIDANGYLVNSVSNGERASGYIPAVAGKKYTLSVWIPKTNTPWIALAFYNTSKQFISRSTYNTNTTIGEWYVTTQTFTAPENTAYIRASARLFGAGRAWLIAGDTSPLIPPPALLNPFGCLLPAYVADGMYVYPSIDTAKRTVTFPADTMIIDSRLSDGYVILPKTEVTYTNATSAIMVYYNCVSGAIETARFNTPLNQSSYIPLITLRTSTKTVGASCPVYVDGKLYGVIPPEGVSYNSFVKSVNHRGFMTIAPENTLPAFKLSKQNGFEYVETDIAFTSDGVPVLLHDSTVDRTSNGTGSISDMTFAQARELDFGSWKDEKYTGTKIPSWEEFIILCRNLGLKIYAELKGAPTQAQIDNIISIARKYRMVENITWISFSDTSLERVLATLPSARVGFIISAATAASITTCTNLKTATNDVFLDCFSITSELIASAQAVDIPVEMWDKNTKSSITEADDYVSGFTSNDINAAKLFIDNAMVTE